MHRQLRECSRSGGAALTGLSWDELDGIMGRAVERGMERRDPELPRHLGIDEKAMFKRHKYATIITDLDGGRVVDVDDQRSIAAVEPWFAERKEALKGVRAVVSVTAKPTATRRTPYPGDGRPTVQFTVNQDPGKSGRSTCAGLWLPG